MHLKKMIGLLVAAVALSGLLESGYCRSPSSETKKYVGTWYCRCDKSTQIYLHIMPGGRWRNRLIIDKSKHYRNQQWRIVNGEIVTWYTMSHTKMARLPGDRRYTVLARDYFVLRGGHLISKRSLYRCTDEKSGKISVLKHTETLIFQRVKGPGAI